MKKSFADLQKIINKRGGMSFHDAIQKDRRDNPGALDRKRAEAEETAKQGVQDFLSTVRDYKKPGHERALAQYKNDYNYNPVAVDADFKEKAYAKNGVPKDSNMYADASKESRLLSEYRVTNSQGGASVIKYRQGGSADDQAAFAKFQDYVRTYIKALGYDGIEDAIKDFWNENYMSTMQV